MTIDTTHRMMDEATWQAVQDSEHDLREAYATHVKVEEVREAALFAPVISWSDEDAARNNATHARELLTKAKENHKQALARRAAHTQTDAQHHTTTHWTQA